jgi:Zn finger protein HypA/HybF involved in hydrogenase expression
MNKKQILASLNKIANRLDNNNLFKEANTITNVMIKVAENDINFDPRQKEFPLDTYRAMGPARGGHYKFKQNTTNNEPNLPNFPDEEDEREDCCPNCGNCEERLASDPSVIVMERYSNGVVWYCENNNCSYNYWEDAKEGVKDPICPICNRRELYFENERDPYQHMTCGNTECNAVFIDGLEVKQ